MRMSKDIKKRVIRWLQAYPFLRDDDERLLANMWAEDNKLLGAGDLNSFLKLLASKQLTSSESIRRVRQKIQEEHPELRGAKYKARHDHAEKIQKDLGYG